AVLDRDSVFEVGPRHGRSLITALARLDGRPVGVLASDPEHYGGGLTAEASGKLSRFVDLCDQFHVPVVNFVDQPGFVIGSAAERAGTIRHGTRALYAVYQATVPWVSVLVRKVYGWEGARPAAVSAAPAIRVLLVEDHELYRQGLDEMLRGEGFAVVGQAGRGDDGVALALRARPDVVVMDLNLPGLPGAEATRRIVAEAPEVRVLVLTISTGSVELLDALLAGARGYLVKGAPLADL